MPYVDGVGDEVVLVAIFATPVLFVICSSTGLFTNLRKGFTYLRTWLARLFHTPSEQPASITPAVHTTMDSPDGSDFCSVCHDAFTLPCQANCSHWFCGDCILRVWQHGPALQPCRCPICRRNINLLMPGRAFHNNHTVEAERILRDVSKYNRLFGGAPISLIQRLRDMPLLVRRFFRELLDPQRAIQILHRTRFLLVVLLALCYVVSPIDLLPEAVLGLIGLVDDALVVLFTLFQISMIYRRLVVHGSYR